MQKTDLNTIDLLLQRSLEQYGEIYELLQTIGPKLDTHLIDHIRKFDETLGGLQKMVQRTDQQLDEKLEVVEVPEIIVEPLARRKVLQEKILVLLKETVSRANSAKSLLASEMQSLKHGRKALNGYKINSSYQTRIIDRKL